MECITLGRKKEVTFVWIERKTMKVIMAHPMSIHMKLPTLA